MKIVTTALLGVGIVMAAAMGYAGQNVQIQVDGGTLHGTLEVPRGKTPCPVTLIIAGSGPTDRDGNNPLNPGKNDSLKLLAQGLAAQGIASVRYDKRGIGESAAAMAAEKDLRFETYIDDAVAWVKALERDELFSGTAVIGHSEGALIGLEACRKAGINAFVSLSGAGVPAADLLLGQLKAKLPEALFKRASSAIDSLSRGELTDDVPRSLYNLLRPSVQPYLISWFRYDPARDMAKLSIPVLVLHGTTDIQLDTENARRLAKANPGARLLLIRGMNHVLKEAPADPEAQIAAYTDPGLPLARGLVKEISRFLKTFGAARSSGPPAVAAQPS